MATSPFSMHLPPATEREKPWKLTPDANFSRNVSFHVVYDPTGRPAWVGRYLIDLLEYVALMHENGLLVDIEGEEYLLTVAPNTTRNPHG